MVNKKKEARTGPWLPVVCLGIALVATLVDMPVSVQAQGVRGGAGVSRPNVAGVTAQAESAATLAYWTPERLRAAAANPLSPEPLGAQPVVAGNSATGAPGAAGGVLPGGVRMSSPPSLANFPTTSSGIVPADGPYRGPGTFFKWYPRYRTYPVSTIAKMFFSEYGTGYSCSASTTYAGSFLDSVWTAGHCVHAGNNDPGGWSTNVLICPSYVNGVNPAVGCWAGTNVATSNEWYGSGWFSRDYGFVITASSGTVINNWIANVTGGLGFAWNFGRDQHWFNFGYPALPNPPFNGGAINLCAAEHRYDVVTDAGPATNSMGCNSGRGSSGGPWILAFASGNWINSVNSWLYLAQEGIEIQGPYHDTQVCNFWKAWAGWSGTC